MPNLRVLMVEDDRVDQLAFQRFLNQQGLKHQYRLASSIAEARQALDAATFDVVIIEYHLPDGTALDLLPATRGAAVVVACEIGNESAAILALHQGASDYLIKDPQHHYLTNLETTVEGAIAHARADTELREQAALLDTLADAVVVSEMNGRVTFWNRAAERLYGWPKTAALRRNVRELLVVSSPRQQEAETLVLEKGTWRGEMARKDRAGNSLIVDARWTLILDDAEAPKAILQVYTDVASERRKAARALQVQRQESVMTLVRGISHHLNNALTPILLGAGLLRQPMSEVKHNQLLDMLERSALEAAEIIKQLVVYSHGAGGDKQLLDMEDVLSRAEQPVRSRVPQGIELEWAVCRGLWRVLGDETQLNRAILNLCANACAAMKGGGRLWITVENKSLEPTSADLPPDLDPGCYVVVRVADTGAGIPPELLDRIFEPFFTTQKFHEATGLGLSAVFGIARSHGGMATATSEPGKGSVFSLYLPAVVSPEVEKGSG